MSKFKMTQRNLTKLVNNNSLKIKKTLNKKLMIIWTNSMT